MNRILSCIIFLVVFSCHEKTNDLQSDAKEVTDSGLNKNADTLASLDVKSFEVDHPLWDDSYIRNYDVNDLENMLEVSSSYKDSINLVVSSFYAELNKSGCLGLNKKNTIKNALDSLVQTHNSYVYWNQQCEVISYRDGKAAGKNSIDYEIYLNTRFLAYLKHLTNSLYFAYLEPGVVPCE